MTLCLSAVAYLVAGFLTDYLVATYYLCLSERRRVEASALAVAIDLFGFLVTVTLVLGKNFVGAFSFAVGTGIGTYVALGRK